jgi:hypothetical protein
LYDSRDDIELYDYPEIAPTLPKAFVLREVTYKEQRIKDLCDLHQAVQANGDDWPRSGMT